MLFLVLPNNSLATASIFATNLILTRGILLNIKNALQVLK